MAKSLKVCEKTPNISQKSKKIVYPPQPLNSTQSKQVHMSLPKSDKTNSKFRIKVKNQAHNYHSNNKN